VIDDETTDYGRFTPEHEPLGEDELYAVILALVRQDCGGGNSDTFDSWAIGAYERAILALADAGFVELDGQGRIGATLTETGRNFEAWMDAYDRRRRVAEARHRLATVRGLTPEGIARLYDITVADLAVEPPHLVSGLGK
jgi:hypothetical protein